MTIGKQLKTTLNTPDARWFMVALALVLLYISTFTWLAIQRHWAFLSEFDLGVYNQVVWNTLQGRIFYYTSTGQPLLHLSNHADPFLLFLAPFYLIYSGPETLLFLQTSLIALAGLPLYSLGREKLNSNWAALCLLAAYLLFPAIQVVTMSDFHPPALAFAFLMIAFYFLEKNKASWFLFFVILAMGWKEQVPLQVIFLGLYAIIKHRRWWLGGTTIVLAATWFVVVMYWVIPAYSVTGDHIFLNYYAHLGHSPVEIVTTTITRPDLVLKTLWQPARLRYLLDVFAPFGFLSIVGLPTLLIGLPSFAINLLSANPAMHDASRGHYVADVIPWVAWGALFGIVYLEQGFKKLWPKSTIPFGLLLSGLLAGLAIVWHLFYGLSPLAFNNPTWPITAHDRLGHQLLEQIPEDAPVSAQSQLYAHVSRRKLAYVFPQTKDTNYIFLDVTSDTVPLHPNNQRDEINNLLAEQEFGLLAANDGYLLLKRGLSSNNTLPDEFYNFARQNTIKPQYPLTITFDNKIQLLGFDIIDNPRREETVVRFYWQALQPIKNNLRLYPFFLNSVGEVVEDTQLRPMITQVWYPPQQWQVGEYIVSNTLPWPLGDEWSLGVGVLAEDDWTQWNHRLKITDIQAKTSLRRFQNNTWVRLATFKRHGLNLVEVVPNDLDLKPPVLKAANFNNQMQLLGYGTTQDDEALKLTLYWQPIAKMGLDYTIFVHLLDAEDNVIAQDDSQPWNGVSIPTSTWQPGEILRDQHTLLTPNLPSGSYKARIGVYYWQTGDRLPILENGEPVNDFINLEPIIIEN